MKKQGICYLCFLLNWILEVKTEHNEHFVLAQQTCFRYCVLGQMVSAFWLWLQQQEKAINNKGSSHQMDNVAPFNQNHSTIQVGKDL